MTLRFYSDKVLNSVQIPEEMRNEHLTLLGSIVIVLLFNYKSTGGRDSRFKTLVYLVPMIMAVINTGMLGALTPAESLLKILLISVLPAIIYSILAFRSIFSLSEGYRDEFEKLFNQYKQGNITARISDTNIVKDTIYGPIAHFVNLTLDTIEDNVKRVLVLDDLISAISENLAASTEESSSQLNEVNNSMQLVSNGAAQQAELISEVDKTISETDQIVREIAQQIKIYTDSVSQIALQTNILALNAGIEASRAGDYGRGFAVVAENVRKLSDETKIISEQISDVTENIIKTLISNSNKSREGFDNVLLISEETAAFSVDVLTSIQEIDRSVMEVTKLTSTLFENANELSDFLKRFKI